MSICDERRRRGERIVLAAFAREHGIHADTLRPYIREDLSLRKPIHYVGQQKLINDGEMEEFCQRMVREYPELMPRDVILELISSFDIEAVQARNQFDKIVKRRCVEIVREQVVQQRQVVPLPRDEHDRVVTSVVTGDVLHNTDAIAANIVDVTSGHVSLDDAVVLAAPIKENATAVLAAEVSPHFSRLLYFQQMRTNNHELSRGSSRDMKALHNGHFGVFHYRVAIVMTFKAFCGRAMERIQAHHPNEDVRILSRNDIDSKEE